MTISAAAETYFDVERMLAKIVHGFLAHHRGGELDGLYSFDDAMSVAKVACLEAYGNWDAGRSRFSTHVWLRVHQALCNAKRDAMRKRCLPPGNGVSRFSEMEEPDFSDREPGFDLSRLLADASDDAQTIIKALLDAPAEVVECWVGNHGRVLQSKRAKVRRYARQRGWSPSRFWRAWWEAAELVTG